MDKARRIINNVSPCFFYTKKLNKNHMRTNINFLILFTFSIFIIGCSQKKEEPKQPEKEIYTDLKEGDIFEISGRLICAHCFVLNKDNIEIDHQLPREGFVKDCAITCAKQNYPIAILLDSPVDRTSLWVIRTAGDIFADYMTKTLTVKGEYVYSGLIDPTSLKVKIGDEWKSLKLKKFDMVM